jgi:energy-coupling factor transporter ATP-binding protein EcfA2
MKEPLKIISFTAENVKKLKVIDITPTKDFITVTGKNGSGKSSVLDAIWYALAGKDNIPGKPVRDGAMKARIRLNLGEYIVERRFNAESGNTTLTVETADGAKYSSPQAILDEIVGQLTFDPLEFARMQPKQQFDMLRRVSKVAIDLDALAKADKDDYEARRDANRDVKMLDGPAQRHCGAAGCAG